MAKHVWSVLCYKGVLDQYTNQVSLLDVIEGITAKPLEPVPEGPDVRVPINMMLVTLWTRSDMAVPEVVTTRIRTIVPSGESRDGGQIVTVDLTKFLRSRSFIRFQHLPFRGEGFFYFVVELHDEKVDQWLPVAEIPLEFKLEQPSAAPEAPAPSRESPATHS